MAFPEQPVDPYAFLPPAAHGLPKSGMHESALDSATSGASMLDAYALTPNGRNLLAHALTQLARDGWLRQAADPAQAFDPHSHPRPAAAPQEAP